MVRKIEFVSLLGPQNRSEFLPNSDRLTLAPVGAEIRKKGTKKGLLRPHNRTLIVILSILLRISPEFPSTRTTA